MNSPSNTNIGGDFKTLIRISFPLLFFLFCETLTSFCERIFLSYHSVEGVHASLNATYLASIFQSPAVAIGAMGQVFVGLYQGSGELKRIGPCIWQLIWFSVLSSLITLPLSALVSHFYFKDTSIHHAGTEYFNILAKGNFLFPLSISLSSFYLGRGKTARVTFLMLTSYALNLVFSWFFIFGIPNILPALGIKGAALAKCCSLSFLSCSFLASFLSRENRRVYNTGHWRFSPPMLWHCIRPGLVRAFGYLSSKAWWAGITYLMIKKGNTYLDVLTIGGTIITFLTFIASGIYRSILTICSNLLGSNNYEEIWKLCRSFMIYTGMIAVILLAPLIVFPNTLAFFFSASSQEVFRSTFQSISHWIWLYLVALIVQMSLCSLIVSARDLKWQFYCYLFSGLVSFCFVYLSLYKGGWQPDRLWMIMTIENGILATIFFIRLRKKSWAEKAGALS